MVAGASAGALGITGGGDWVRVVALLADWLMTQALLPPPKSRSYEIKLLSIHLTIPL